MTYFHTGIRTIIGAESFHGPVRDGKGWDRLAMVIRHERDAASPAGRRSQPGRSVKSRGILKRGCVVSGTARDLNPGGLPRIPGCGGAAKHTGYRIKPYGQLVSVSLTHYCASTPDLSTSWS